MGGEEAADVCHGWLTDGFAAEANKRAGRIRICYTRFIRSTAISTRSGVAGASSLGQTR